MKVRWWLTPAGPLVLRPRSSLPLDGTLSLSDKILSILTMYWCYRGSYMYSWCSLSYWRHVLSSAAWAGGGGVCMMTSAWRVLCADGTCMKVVFVSSFVTTSFSWGGWIFVLQKANKEILPFTNWKPYYFETSERGVTLYVGAQLVFRVCVGNSLIYIFLKVLLVAPLEEFYTFPHWTTMWHTEESRQL